MTNIETMKDRPGLPAEKAYYYWLLNCINKDPDYAMHGICKFRWDSLFEKSSYDFAVDTLNYDGRIFVDVVGYSINNADHIRLNTSHKDFKSQIAELSDPNQNSFYDCFKAYETFFYGGEWLYLEVRDNLPRGNITLDKKRFKTIRRAKTVFGDNAKHIYLDLKDCEVLTLEQVFQQNNNNF